MSTLKLRSLFYILVVLAVAACSRGVPEDMVLVPAGEFIMGAGGTEKVFLKAFYMDRYEVTNARYREFVAETGRKEPRDWIVYGYSEEKKKHPVVFVSYDDARAYCEWAGKRLPTEAEWEKAARGPNGNIYPWGDDFDIKKANFSSPGPVAVGSYPTDRSPYGVYDMAGNVMEWVEDWYEPYPGNTSKNKDFGRKYKVLRGDASGEGGHYMLNSISARGSNRSYYMPWAAGYDGGFRCAADSQ